MTHPLAILGIILVGLLATYFVVVWALGWLRRMTHRSRLIEQGRVIGWPGALERLRERDLSIIVFEALAQRVWLVEDEARDRFVDGYNADVGSRELAMLLEERGVFVHPLPCRPRGRLVDRRLRDAGLSEQHVFLDSDFDRRVRPRSLIGAVRGG